MSQAPLTVTADHQSKTYGAADPTLTYTPSGTLYYGDTYAVISGVTLSTTTGAAATAGTHTIIATGGTAANYAITDVNGTLTVAQAPLTVTPTAESMTYGGAVPALTYTYTGLVYSDTSASFTGSLATTATSSSNVGSYAITQGTLAATGNYTIGTFNPAAPPAGNAGFEAPAVPGSYIYNPTGTAWTFSGTSPSGSGVAGNNSAFTSGNPSRPARHAGRLPTRARHHHPVDRRLDRRDLYHLFLRREARQQRRQPGLPGAGRRHRRRHIPSHDHDVRDVYDAHVQRRGRAHTIKFLGLDTAGGDNTDFLDAVSLASANVLTVNPAQTAVALSSSANPAVPGQSVTFTAIVAPVAPGGGTPTGSVTFKNGTTVLGTVPLSVVGGQDQATFTTTFSTAGTPTIIGHLRQYRRQLHRQFGFAHPDHPGTRSLCLRDHPLHRRRQHLRQRINQLRRHQARTAARASRSTQR